MSHSLSQTYGTNLPTSLTYIVLPPEAVHLGDLLRIWVRPGAKTMTAPRDFQGPARAHRTPREARCFTGTKPLSPAEPIPGVPSLTKKRKLSPRLPPASPGSFALPLWPPRGRLLHPGSGILTRFPFDLVRGFSMLIQPRRFSQNCLVS